LFRRKSDQVESTPVESSAKPGGKGRPTPSRKEAEARRKALAKAPRSRKELAAARSADRAKASQGMRAGDERYLLPRDRGPVRRFVRDWIDSRFTIGEIVLPLLVATLILGFVGNQRIVVVANMVMLALLVVIIVNLVLLRFGLRRELKRRFPDESWSGTTWYAVTRSLQMRLLRMPKPQYKIGQQIPETYR
jgi:hypothetical protein